MNYSKDINVLKKDLREKIVDIWGNPDNPPEDKLIEIFEYTTEQIIDFVENNK